MSIEAVLFLVVGVVSVGSAAFMVTTRNAVHSALYLILNFACVAFFYLMLDAPFLALVQIAVYAGAIMVLFLFVIMLLGAEQAIHEVRQFKWLAPITLTLALSFMTAVGLAFFDAGMDETPPPQADPLVRVVNVSVDIPSADVYFNDVLVVEALPYGGTSEDNELPYMEVEPGEYSVRIAAAGGDSPRLAFGSFTVEPGDSVTLLAYGAREAGILPGMTVIEQDLNYFLPDSGRMTVVNVYDETPVSIYNAGTDGVLQAEETEVEANIIAQDLGLGESVTFDRLRLGNKNWVFTAGELGSEVEANVLARLSDFEVTDKSVNIALLTYDTNGEELLPLELTVVGETFPQFGSPEAIGGVLFTDYVLQFELVALLLLAAMVGAIVVTQRTNVKPKPGRPTRRKVSRPLTSVIASQTGQAVTVEDAPDDVEPKVEQPQPAGD